MRCSAPLIKRTFFDWGRFLCYLLTLAAIPPIKTFFLISFVNIILFLTLFPILPGISLIGLGILTFPLRMHSCGTNTLSSALSQELLPVCNGPSCSTTIYLWLISLTASKELSFLLLKLYNVWSNRYIVHPRLISRLPHSLIGLHSLKSIPFMPF